MQVPAPLYGRAGAPPPAPLPPPPPPPPPATARGGSSPPAAAAGRPRPSPPLRRRRPPPAAPGRGSAPRSCAARPPGGRRADPEGLRCLGERAGESSSPNSGHGGHPFASLRRPAALPTKPPCTPRGPPVLPEEPRQGAWSQRGEQGCISSAKGKKRESAPNQEGIAFPPNSPEGTSGLPSAHPRPTCPEQTRATSRFLSREAESPKPFLAFSTPASVPGQDAWGSRWAHSLLKGISP